MPDYNIRLVVEGVDRASGPLRGVSGALGQMATIAGGIQLARVFDGIVAGAQSAGQALAGAVVGAGDLQRQIDGIGALAGANEAELAALSDTITALGVNPNLAVSTQQAADAIEMLVRNGMSLGDVMGGAAEQVVLLANATNADFGTAADIATDAMAIFGISADDMATAINEITGVVASSKFSIEDYQLALAQGGAAASVAGVSFEDFNTSVAAIASNFASGSDAGTSLKTMFQRLVPQSKEAAAAIGELGLEFFNADGSMKGMADIAAELNRAFAGQVEFTSEIGGRTAEQNDELKRLQGRYATVSASVRDYEAGTKGASLTDEKRAKKLAELNGELAALEAQMKPLQELQGDLVTTTRALSEEERIAYLTTIFGTDAMRAAAAMAGYTEEEFAALQKRIGQTDALAQAQQRMNNLSGDMEIFGGVVEAVGLQIGAEFEEPARALFQGLTAALDGITPKLLSFAGQASQAMSGAVAALQSPEVQQAASAAWTAIESIFTGQALTVTVDYKTQEYPEGLPPPKFEPIKMSDLLSGDKVVVPVKGMWEGESVDKQIQKAVNTKWTVNVLGLWEMELPDWLKAGALTVLVELSQNGPDALGIAVGEAVQAGVDSVDWNSAGGGFAAWFAAQNFQIPIALPGGKTGTIEVSGEGLINALNAFEWPEVPVMGWLSAITLAGNGLAAQLSTAFGQAGDNLSYSLNAALANVQSGFAGLVTGLTSWEWPELPEMPEFEWPEMPQFRWPVMPSFAWPALPTWTWPKLPSFSWPAIPLPSWWGGGEGDGAAVGGTRSGLTWVGEFGPELVTLPNNSYVHTAGQSRRMAADGGGQVVNIYPTINTPLDVEEWTRVIADRIRRR